ncbi:MAG: hypothetical protein MUP98_01550, partial [Candidatus Aminicenantes bacterium]|nr:hypothetical protein [Candidatus Aminicenantes bacterium]
MKGTNWFRAVFQAKFIMGIFAVLLLSYGISFAGQEDYEPLAEDSCLGCHETGKNDVAIEGALSQSIHAGFGCIDCHSEKNTMPHKESDIKVGLEGCSACHESEAEEYKVHGRLGLKEDADLPTCTVCHGDHDILPSTEVASKTYPGNLPKTCGSCHADIDMIEKHQIRENHPINIYDNSIHGKSVQGGLMEAATCNDCHSTEGTAHQIYSQGNPNSSINHFNIPDTCGKCHEVETKEYWDGIHGQLAKRGDTETPVCTHCHGEHGIISPSDPASPVSRAQLAESTCTPCHESITLTEKYGVSVGRRPSFIDNYHGLKSQSGDLFVANCASCHGVHRILPSPDPNSSVNPANLAQTCGVCHPGISTELAATPIHEVFIKAQESKTVKIIKIVYILAIFVIIGLMFLHWLIDYVRQIVLVTKKPQVRRMLSNEVWQHTLLMVSFIVLAVTGFCLRYGDAWYAKLLFGWDHGFAMRGIIHRIAAVVLVFASLWHTIFLMSKRGRTFIKDMFPSLSDAKHFFQRIMFN